MMNYSKTLVAFLLVAGIGLVQPARLSAAIIVTDLFHLGESDSPAAVNGGAGNATTADSAGSATLSKVGSPTYIGIGGTASGSSFSMLLNGSSAYSSASSVLTSTSTNFGLEIMVAPTVANQNATLFYNGKTNSGGWGLILSNGIVNLLYGNQLIFAAPSALPLNQWSGVALTRNNGGNGANLYINKTLVAFSSANGPNLPTGGLAIGKTPEANSGFFTGYVDEARIFTFSNGAFNAATDLQDRSLVPIPEPSTIGLIGFGIGALAILRRRK